MKCKEIVDDALDLVDILGVYFIVFILILGIALGLVLVFYYFSIVLFDFRNIFDGHLFELAMLMVYSFICWVLYGYATFRD